MDSLLGLGAALAAMRPDDGRRYRGCLMLSALPDAPVVPEGTRAPRLRRLLAAVRLPPRRRRSAGGVPGGPEAAVSSAGAQALPLVERRTTSR